jgi:hypothetical protein
LQGGHYNREKPALRWAELASVHSEIISYACTSVCSGLFSEQVVWAVQGVALHFCISSSSAPFSTVSQSVS